MKKISQSSNSEKTIPKTFSLTTQDIEKIMIIKDRYLNKKMSLTDSAVIRVALDIALSEKDNKLTKHFMGLKKLPLGRKKNLDTNK